MTICTPPRYAPSMVSLCCIISVISLYFCTRTLESTRRADHVIYCIYWFAIWFPLIHSIGFSMIARSIFFQQTRKLILLICSSQKRVFGTSYNTDTSLSVASAVIKPQNKYFEAKRKNGGHGVAALKVNECVWSLFSNASVVYTNIIREILSKLCSYI